MAVDERSLERAVGAVVDAELDLPLGEVGMVHSVEGRRHRAEVVLALPVEPWPGLDDLRRRVAAAASGVPEVEDVVVDVAVMGDTDREALRLRLRRRMSGNGSEPSAGEGGQPAMQEPHGAHSHGGHSHGAHSQG
ncbi:MAG TPA: hypothetical protein VMD28_03795, partial [Acidimicrobiales bacterium]|nr:hypothetical protein [Acidimicrobiales bacterium]